MSGPVVAVNGRFLTMTSTGVQRYAHEILRRIGAYQMSELRVIVPPNRVLESDDPEISEVSTTQRWHGVGGHGWEQIALPRLVRKAGARALWSPCSWGPVGVRRHVPVIHDVAPLTHPEYFTPTYRALARTLTGPLVRRSALVATPSASVRDDLLQRFALDPDHVRVVPPGVGQPFNSVPLDDLKQRGGRYCLLVGADVSRKNAEFLLEIWPEVRARTNLELHFTYRRVHTSRRLRTLKDASAAGVVLHADPTDAELALLYADALCLLWPSHYEGYGFPLLEAMAVGTPFLSTDVGAAADLAVVRDEQILPLEPERWCRRLEEWCSADLDGLRKASAQRARAQTWDVAAEQTARLLDQVAQSA